MTTSAINANIVTENGEIIPLRAITNSVAQILRANKKRGRHFMKIYKGVHKIALEQKFKPSTWSLFWYVVDTIQDDTNTILLNQTRVSKELGMTPESLASGLKQLLACGFLKIAGKEGPFSKVMLNPDIGFIGDENSRDKIVIIFDELE